MEVGYPRGDRVGEVLMDDCELSITPVDVVPRKEGVGAQVLPVGGAELTLAAGAVEPGDPHPLPEVETVGPTPQVLDHADDLVTGGQWRLVGGQLSLDDVEIGATDPTGGDLDPDLTGPRPRRGYVLEYEGSAGHGGRMLQAHGLHGILIPPSGQQMVSARPAAS